MPMVVGVILRKTKDKLYASTERFDLKLNDKVILVTEHGIECGTVCEKKRNVQKNKNPIGRVLRKITKDDKRRLVENEKRNLKANEIVVQKVDEHNLRMKLVCVQYIFDRSKLFVYYTSEIRVDFRRLIKDLAHIIKSRIQMVQIGVRDESKIIGGMGTCGRTLCCQSFLKHFSSVTIDMAKDQDLSLNTAKLSGLCDRLRCCISYENDTYRTIKKDLPKVGTVITLPEGKAKLAAIDCIREMVTVDFGNRLFKLIPIKQIKDNK